MSNCSSFVFVVQEATITLTVVLLMKTDMDIPIIIKRRPDFGEAGKRTEMKQTKLPIIEKRTTKL